MKYYEILDVYEDSVVTLVVAAISELAGRNRELFGYFSMILRPDPGTEKVDVDKAKSREVFFGELDPDYYRIICKGRNPIGMVIVEQNE